MAIIVPKAVVTLVGRNYFANVIGGKLSPLSAGFKYFQVGVDGYTVVGGDKIPKDPDENRTQLEAVELGHFYFQKNLAATDIVVSGRLVTVNAKLDNSEGNDDGAGHSPEYFEVGLFSDTDVLIVYGTAAGVIKDSSFALTYRFTINF
jgi:hypothetical protein